MRALIAGGGMAGLMTALALRESGVFTTIDVFEQTRTPSTAGAGLNVPPNGARLCRWLGVDLDGGDPKGPDGAVDGGRAAILHETRMVWEDGSITRKPLDHNTSAGDGAGFHHMHRLDLLMALYKRVLEFAPGTGAPCPIAVHMARRLEAVSQDDGSVTVTFSDGTTATGDLLIGADGVNSRVLDAVWPGVSTKRWTEVVVYRGLVARERVAAACKRDGGPLDHNPIETMSMDSRETATAQSLTYWVRGGELLNVWLAYYEPNADEFEREEGDSFPADREEMVGNMSAAFAGDPRHDDVVALASLMENPTKWGLYDRDALENWTEVASAWWATPPTRCYRPSARAPHRPSRTPRRWGSAWSSTAATSTARCCTTSACATTARRASSSRQSSSSSTSSRRTRRSAGGSSRRSTSATTRSSITPSVPAATTRGSTRSTRARSATSCRSGSSGRGTSAREPRRSAPARRSPAASGSRRSERRATGPSRARSSRSTRPSTTAGSSSAARSTTSPSGRTTIRAIRGPDVRRQGRHRRVRRVPQPARRATHGALLRRPAHRTARRAHRRRRLARGAGLVDDAVGSPQMLGRAALRVKCVREVTAWFAGDGDDRRRPVRSTVGPLADALELSDPDGGAIVICIPGQLARYVGEPPSEPTFILHRPPV